MARSRHSPNMTPEGEGHLYRIKGRVDPPVEGDETVEMLTIQPSTEAVISRFIWNFRQMGHTVRGITAVERIESPDALTEYLEGADLTVPEHVRAEAMRYLSDRTNLSTTPP